MKSASRVNPVVFGSAVLAIGVYFFYFTGGGLHTGFTHDDLMNLWRAWRDPLPHILLENVLFFLYPLDYRPMGSLFYHVFYDAFGLNPLPYRICMLVFLLANIGLVYAFARRIARSREIGGITALLHGYHIGFVPLYRNTGTCFDILCGFFYFSALAWYLRIRQQERLLRPLEYAGVLGLFIFSLDAKEIAVTLPVAIGLYELLYHPPQGFKPRVLISWLTREGGVMCWGAGMDLAFLIGKIYWTNGIGRTVSPYMVTINFGTFMRGLRHDLDEVFITWGTQALREPNLAILLLLLFLFAWRSRLPHFRYGLLFWLIGVLPVAFIPTRSIYAIYIPLAGFDLCAATLLVEAREWLWRGLQRRAHLAGRLGTRQILTFILLLVVLSRYYSAHGARFYTWLDEQSHQITTVIDELRAQLPSAKKGAQMLFMKDPFPNVLAVEWATVFITHLLYRDHTIQPDRLWRMAAPPDAERMKQYDYIFTMEGPKDKEKLVMVTRR